MFGSKEEASKQLAVLQNAYDNLNINYKQLIIDYNVSKSAKERDLQDWFIKERERISASISSMELKCAQQLGVFEHEYHSNQEARRGDIKALDAKIEEKKKYLDMQNDYIKKLELIIDKLLGALNEKQKSNG